MAAAPVIENPEAIRLAVRDARREVRRTSAQARKANAALARLEEQLAALGIRLVIDDEGD